MQARALQVDEIPERPAHLGQLLVVHPTHRVGLGLEYRVVGVHRADLVQQPGVEPIHELGVERGAGSVGERAIAVGTSSSKVNSTATDATCAIRAHSGIAVPASGGWPLPFQAVNTLCTPSATRAVGPVVGPPRSRPRRWPAGPGVDGPAGGEHRGQHPRARPAGRGGHLGYERPQQVGRALPVGPERHPGRRHLVAEDGRQPDAYAVQPRCSSSEVYRTASTSSRGRPSRRANRVATRQRVSDSSRAEPVPRSSTADSPPSSPRRRNTRPRWHSGSGPGKDRLPRYAAERRGVRGPTRRGGRRGRRRSPRPGRRAACRSRRSRPAPRRRSRARCRRPRVPCGSSG